MKPMKDYELAFVVVVKQQGVDINDAANRALFNLQWTPGQTFERPVPFAPSQATIVGTPIMVMSRETT